MRALSALEINREGTTSLNSNLESEEDNAFANCDLESNRTRFLSINSSNLCITFCMFYSCLNKLSLLGSRYK